YERCCQQNVEQRGPQIDREVERSREDLPGAAHEVEYSDDAGKGAGLHQQDDFISEGRPGDTVGMREYDPAKRGGSRQADSLGRLDLALRHAHDPAAEYFRLVGRAVERKRQKRAIEGIAEEPPQSPFGEDRPELTGAVVDEEKLRQGWRAAKEGDVDPK